MKKLNKRDIFDAIHEYKKLKDRIDKAIDYINKHNTSKYNYSISLGCIDELLEILKGEDNDN